MSPIIPLGLAVAAFFVLRKSEPAAAPGGGPTDAEKEKYIGYARAGDGGGEVGT